MSRDELVDNIIVTVGATTPEQVDKINADLSHVILLVELRFNKEILITDLTKADLDSLKREVIRRYKT